MKEEKIIKDKIQQKAVEYKPASNIHKEKGDFYFKDIHIL